MPQGGDPPDPGLPQAVFTALNAMQYDAAGWAFKDGTVLNYMFVEKKTGAIECGQWFYGTDADGRTSPRAQIPSATYNIIKNGSYNATTQLVSYGGHTYRFRLARDLSAGKQVAAAIVVT